jgi:hypothetical protein
MHDRPSDAALAKIRALCTDLAKRHHIDDDARDELCAHLEDKLSGYLSGRVPVSEEDALCLVRAHFGDADRVAKALAGGAAEREAFLSARVNHARLYSVLLVVLGLSTMLSVPLGLVLWAMRQSAFSGRAPLPLPMWAGPAWAGICTLYLLAIGVTLWARSRRSQFAPGLTPALNLALLLAPPFGTLLGIYGLITLNRRADTLVPLTKGP